MNHLKIVQQGFAGYTGDFGGVAFVDGVSTEPVPKKIADRISSQIQMMDVDAKGKELGAAGIAQRLVGGATVPAAVLEPSQKPTAAEVDAERRRIEEEARATANVEYFTVEQLETIAEKEGIAGLRKIAGPWKVKDRQINGLIREIIKAQDDHKQKKAEKAAEQKKVAAAAAAASIESQAKHAAEIEEKARVFEQRTEHVVVTLQPGEQIQVVPVKPKEGEEPSELVPPTADEIVARMRAAGLVGLAEAAGITQADLIPAPAGDVVAAAAAGDLAAALSEPQPPIENDAMKAALAAAVTTDPATSEIVAIIEQPKTEGAAEQTDPAQAAE